MLAISGRNELWVQKSLLDLIKNKSFSFDQFVAVEVHHLLLSSDEIQSDTRLHRHQFLQHQPQKQLIRKSMHSLDCMHELHRDFPGPFQRLSQNIGEKLFVLLALLGPVGWQHAE